MEDPRGRLCFGLSCFGLEVSLVGVCLQDLQQRVQKHSEVEMVDLVLKLKDKLVSVNQRSLVFKMGLFCRLSPIDTVTEEW